MGNRKTHKEYIEDVARTNPNIEVLGTYLDVKTSILHRCKIHDYKWLVRPNNILSGKGCKLCAYERASHRLKKTHNQYLQGLHNIFSTINPIEEYNGDATKILHECLVCKHKWKASPGTLLQKKGCPVCGKHIIGNAPEYINSIWASEYKEFFSEFMTDEQMKCIMPHSGKKMSLPCPNCGKIKDISPANLVNYGFGCICGDGQSFSNKFMYNVLSQLNINVKLEYSPRWASPLKYDDYLIDYNIIIENHGIQHYEEVPFTQRTLKEEQENDLLKYNLARQNAVYDYIVIDCRRATLEWLKKSIMQSKLPHILKFTESDINWTEALMYATHSLVKTASDMFNEGFNIKTIANILQKNISTIRKWLHNATQLGWCEYNPRQSQPIYCIEMGALFITKQKAAQTTHTSVASIINNLNGVYSYAGRHPHTNEKLHWISKVDAIQQKYITQQND